MRIRKAAGRAETALVILFQLLEKSKADDGTGKPAWQRFRNANGNAFRSWAAYLKDVIGSEMTNLAPVVRNPLVELLRDNGLGQAVIADIVGMNQSQVSRVLAEPRRSTKPASDDGTGKARAPKSLAAQFAAMVARIAKAELSDADAQAIADAVRQLPFSVMAKVVLIRR